MLRRRFQKIMLILCKSVSVRIIHCLCTLFDHAHGMLPTHSSNMCRLESPRLSMNYNGIFSLKFSVRAGVDLSSVMAEIVKQFGASEAATVTTP